MACREYTLPRDDESSQPRGWIQGNTKIGPVTEVTTSCLHGKHGVEIRIMSLSRDNTDSWVRISHGSNKFVMDLKNNDTEIPEDQLENQALTTGCKRFCDAKQRQKQNHKEENLLALHQKSFQWKEGIGLDIEPGKYSLSEYEISKKVIHLLRHSQKVHREDDGAVQFLENQRKSSESIPTVYSLV